MEADNFLLSTRRENNDQDKTHLNRSSLYKINNIENPEPKEAEIKKGTFEAFFAISHVDEVYSIP